MKSIPNLNYTKDELDALNRYETMLGKNINSWMVNRIISDSVPTVSDWQNNLLKANRASIDKVLEINQAAYNKSSALCLPWSSLGIKISFSLLGRSNAPESIEP